MTLRADPELHYHCVQCGRSCEGWNVWVEESVVESIRPLEMTLRVVQERGQAFEEEDGRLKMYRTPEHDACGYRLPNLLCNIHADLGMLAKPLGCQQFPYLLRRLPDGEVRVGASFACTAVLTAQGPSLSDCLPEVQSLLERQAYCDDLPERLQARPEEWLEWPQVLQWEERFEELSQLLGWERAVVSALASLCQGQPLQSRLLEGSNWNWFRAVLEMSLLKLCLDDPERSLWAQIDAAVMEGAEFELPQFAWRGNLESLRQLQSERVGGRFAEQQRQYFEALWFRKAHWSLGGLLPGLLMYWALPELLGKLAYLYAHSQGGQVASGHHQEALRLVELSLLAHSKNGALVLERLAPHCLNL